YNAYDLDSELKKTKEEIFKQVSSNSHHGYFIFSIFDDFQRDIEIIINKHQISKSIEELSTLQEFINNFVELKASFNWVWDNTFIKYNQLSDVHLAKSKHTISSDSDEIYYDIIFKSKEGNSNTFYSAKYWIFDQNALTNSYKLSGNKAMEISLILFKLYRIISKWKKLKNIEELSF